VAYLLLPFWAVRVLEQPEDTPPFLSSSQNTTFGYISVDGLGSKATMIEATQDEDEPTELELYCKEHPDAEKCQDNAGG